MFPQTSRVSAPLRKSHVGRLRIAEVLLSGPLTEPAIIERTRDTMGGKYNVQSALDCMVADNQVTFDGSIYTLTEDSKAFVLDLLESAARNKQPKNLVPPRDPPIFRPLSRNLLPNVHGNRPDAPRREEHRIITIGNQEVSPYYDEE